MLTSLVHGLWVNPDLHLFANASSYYILLFQLGLVKANFWFADCQADFREGKRTGSDLHEPPLLWGKMDPSK